MPAAVDQFLGDVAQQLADFPSSAGTKAARSYAEEHLVLYATGSKERPSLSLYDAGEGQLQADFPSTFCSLIHGANGGSYKGAIPFVQGRFNMGSSGALPFCSERHKLQLILSRVPPSIIGTDSHEWAFTVLCFFPSSQDPSWHYLVGPDGEVLTAGTDALPLLPKKNAASGVVSPPREWKVGFGTLVKMYEYKAPRSNICGELFRKIESYMLRPPLPLRLVECRHEYKAHVMRATVYDRLSVWGKDKLEPGFENGASLSVELDSTGESIPVDVRVFKSTTGSGKTKSDAQHPLTGMCALINGQSHARRDTQFFKTKAVDKEHIAGSMLVLLDCSGLGQASRNALFMSNREIFRQDPLLEDLFKKIQRELKNHDALIALNQQRYEEKVKNAVDDEDGLKALESLLSQDKDLAELFGTNLPGSVAGKSGKKTPGTTSITPAKKFEGSAYPTFFARADKTTSAAAEIEPGGTTRVSFLTDVENSYFSRWKHRGKETRTGAIVPTSNLFNGRYTLTYTADKKAAVGSTLSSHVVITDNNGSGPFALDVQLTVIAAKPKPKPKANKPPKKQSYQSHSRPSVREMAKDPSDNPIEIEAIPNSERLQLILNTESELLQHAKDMRPPEEEAAVTFVFKYGLALATMSLIEAAKKTPEWAEDQAACRERIEITAAGLARVIVPMCLSLPKNLPKSK
jgi:hypothetical protein